MKIPCPYCDFGNIEGEDVCEQCGQPLSDMHLSDFRTAVERGLMKDRVSKLSPKKPVTVPASMTVGEVLQLLIERSIGCVFVVDNKSSVVGVFSERDALIRLNCDSEKLWDHSISEFMTPNPQGLRPDAKVVFAVHQMDVGHYRHIPILDDENRAVGVISVRDILQYLTGLITF
jgi:predicted transcriptional regulator